jgi:hypothetical protein
MPINYQTDIARHVKYPHHRIIISKMVIDVMRMLTSTYFEVESFGSSVDEILLVIAVFIGQAEGRPLNAYKLSSFVGIPRATVIRKMKRMQKHRYVEQDESGKYLLPIAALNSRNVINTLAAVVRRIVDTGHQLSKMDSVKLERRATE